ncbi:MAG: ABC transporter permease [Solobacterium sp.]|nr:ABC transporter permease [Solobacterium sp.]
MSENMILFRRRLRYFMRQPLYVCALVIFLFIALACILAPLLAKENYNLVDVYHGMEPPSAEHIFGTDRLGRDHFSRILFAGRVTLGYSLTATLIALGLGLVLGVISGYFGGMADTVIMRITEVLSAVPYFLLVIVFEIMLGFGEGNFKYAMGIAAAPAIIHLVRAETLNVVGSEYIEAARALGFSDLTIILRHVINNIMNSLVLHATGTYADAMLTCSILGYLGIGFVPPQADLGTLIAGGYGDLRVNPHLSLIPCAVIMLSVLSVNLIGNGIRDALEAEV